MKKISLKDAIWFHGHLGPYLVIGLAAGELALETLKAKKYFGVEVKIWGANHRPKSCLIDGLQLSTGATYGKGNIHKFGANSIKILFRNCQNNKKVNLVLDEKLIQKLAALKGHKDSEALARKLFMAKPLDIFRIYR